MRVFIVIVLLLATGIGVAGFALGWFNISTSPDEQKRGLTLTIDPDKVKKDRGSVLGWFQPSTPPQEQKTDSAVAAEKGKKDRDDFEQQAEIQFKAADRSLDELKAKANAKNGHDVTKEKMNQAIDDLTKKTEDAREKLRELKTATQERWDALRTRLSASLEELKGSKEPSRDS